MHPTEDKKKQSALRDACADVGLTVAGLARRIRRARATCYLAWERPSRYSVAYALIQKELTK